MPATARHSLPAALLLVLAACAAPSSTASPSASTATSPDASSSETADACTPDQLATKAPGRLTIGTDNPAFPPYWQPPAGGQAATDPWEFGDPYTKEGFEGAVAWALAAELGFADDDVDFIPVPFTNSFAPGEKDFDIYLALVSYSDERAQTADLSDGYFFSNQALVARADTPITSAASIADVAGYRLGVQSQTTSLTYVEEQIQPTAEVSVYDTNDIALAALNAGQVDGIVVDLATAFYMTGAQMDDGVVVGQFPDAGEEKEHFSMVLEQDSPLTDCVNEAIAALDESGDLESITQEWMSDNAGVPVLE